MHDELIERLVEDVWNKGDMAAADYIFTPSHYYHDPAHPWVTRGAEGIKRLVSAYRNSFPNIALSIGDTFASGEKSVVRFTARAKHLGNFFHLPPTGRSFEIGGINIHRFAEKRIAETWAFWDMLGLFEQLGALPRHMREDTEEAELSYWYTHKLWWQAQEKGTDEPHDEHPQ